MTTFDLTNDIAWLRRHHCRIPTFDLCPTCQTHYPCPAIRVLDALDDVRAVHVETRALAARLRGTLVCVTEYLDISLGACDPDCECMRHIAHDALALTPQVAGAELRALIRLANAASNIQGYGGDAMEGTPEAEFFAAWEAPEVQAVLDPENRITGLEVALTEEEENQVLAVLAPRPAAERDPGGTA